MRSIFINRKICLIIFGIKGCKYMYYVFILCIFLLRGVCRNMNSSYKYCEFIELFFFFYCLILFVCVKNFC